MFNMEQIQEITECCICTDTFTDPRILTCIHTFCLNCLEKTALNNELKPGDTMPCPLCRKSFVIPKDGIRALQKNFFMERFVEISKLSQSSGRVKLCDVCATEKPAKEKRNEIPTAIQFCIQCEQNVCDRCCQEHKRFKELQRHELIPIESAMNDVSMRKVSLQFCDQHNKKELEMYCIDCRQAICMKCFAQTHKSHNCSDVDEVAEEFREQIRRDLDKMSGYETEAVSKVEEVAKLKAEFQKKIEETGRAIIQRGIELKELVDKHTRSLLDELSVINQRVSKEIAIYQQESETHKMIINSFDKYCTELIRKGSNVEMCRAANDLHSRAEELKTIHEEQIYQQISSAEVKFQASNVEEFLKNENIVGKIRVPFRSSGTLTLSSDCLVTGVTKIQNKIYVLCQGSNVIRVFDDENPYEFEKDVVMKEVKYPADIESCEISKCLYISDLYNRCVWRMSVDDHRVKKVLTETQIVNRFTLSITTEGHLLVLRHVEQLNQVEIYGSDGKLVRCISLPNDICRPLHAIQKPNGEFLILHSEIASEGPWVISRLTSDGQKLVTRFNSKDEKHKLNEPSHLALDSENDRLFVADCLKNRVVVFDSLSLKPIDVLLPEQGNAISRPSALHYDEMKKQLIVGQYGGGPKVGLYEAKL